MLIAVQRRFARCYDILECKMCESQFVCNFGMLLKEIIDVDERNFRYGMKDLMTIFIPNGIERLLWLLVH